jgi:hypothetical protein
MIRISASRWRQLAQTNPGVVTDLKACRRLLAGRGYQTTTVKHDDPHRAARLYDADSQEELVAVEDAMYGATPVWSSSVHRVTKDLLS